MQRLDDWEKRLIALANEWRTRPYVYGISDCGCFAQAAIEAVTGVALLSDVERPRGWLSAAKFMIAHGWDSVEDMATELLGAPVEPSLSGPGDIVSFSEGGESHLAVRVGSVALSPSGKGLIVVAAGSWRRAWKVG